MREPSKLADGIQEIVPRVQRSGKGGCPCLQVLKATDLVAGCNLPRANTGDSFQVTQLCPTAFFKV